MELLDELEHELNRLCVVKEMYEDCWRSQSAELCSESIDDTVEDMVNTSRKLRSLVAMLK